MHGSAKKLVELLGEKSLKIATAESCTGGIIAGRITDVPGSSGVFHMGAVTYSDEVKAKLLGVREETLARYGAVSAQTAAEMAEGIRRVAGAAFGLSSTGISGPGGDGRCNEAGLSFIAVSDGGNTVCKKLETHCDDRELNRSVTAEAALELAIGFISDYDGGKP